MRRGILFIAISSVLLASCSPERLQEAQEKAKDAAVKSNMYTVQMAAEAYAADHSGTYPTTIDDKFKSYFPGGDGEKGTKVGRMPVNPFTAEGEWPANGNIKDVEAASNGAPPALKPGEIQYNSLKDATSYAIIGSGRNGKAFTTGEGKTIVLTAK